MVVRRPPRRRGTGSSGLLSVAVGGSRQLNEAATQLRDAGRSDLLRELRQELRKPPKQLNEAVLKGIPKYMPSGYQRTLATSLVFKTSVRTKASSAGVSVSMSSRRDLRALERGRLRHPVFGRVDDSWVNQSIPEGFFSKPASTVFARIQADVIEVIDRVLSKVGSA